MNPEIKFKNRTPFSYLIWIAFVVVITILLLKNTFLMEAIILILLFSTLAYMMLCRNACRIFIVKNGFKVRYYFPLLYEKEVVFKQNMRVEYDLGYYYYFRPEHSIGAMQLVNPCDNLSFYEIKDAEKILYDEVTIYLSYHDFKLLRQYLNEHSLNVER